MVMVDQMATCKVDTKMVSKEAFKAAIVAAKKYTVLHHRIMADPKAAHPMVACHHPSMADLKAAHPHTNRMADTQVDIQADNQAAIQADTQAVTLSSHHNTMAIPHHIMLNKMAITDMGAHSMVHQSVATVTLL